MRNTVLIEKVEQIVLCLGNQWRVDYIATQKAKGYNVYVIGDSGQIIIMRSHKNMISVNGAWPSIFQKYKGHNHSERVIPKSLRNESISINVSFNRHPLATAKDIQNRFLKRYVPLFAEAIAQKKAILKKYDELHHVVDAFKKIDPHIKDSGSYHRPDLGVGNWRETNCSRIQFNRSVGYCSMELSEVPYNVAMQITALLKEARNA